MANNEKRKQFEKLYEREADPLFRFCLLRTSSREQARDIVQETFLRVWKAVMEGTPIAHERAFIYTVARNLVIDWYRKGRTESLDALLEEDEGTFDVAEEGSAERAALSFEAKEAITAIRNLGPKYRDVVYLRLVEDKQPQEIAELLGLKVNVVSVRINRGLLRLRASFKGEGGKRDKPS